MQLTELSAEVTIYSRAQALADGALIDASPLADLAGFPFPVALAFHAYDEAVAWRYAATLAEHQDVVTGRLWDVLAEARKAIHYAYAKWEKGPVDFTVYRVVKPGHAPQPLMLWVDMGPGDDGDPVVTIAHAWDQPITFDPVIPATQGLDD